MSADETYKKLIREIQEIWRDQTISEKKREEVLVNLRDNINALLSAQKAIYGK